MRLALCLEWELGTMKMSYRTDGFQVCKINGSSSTEIEHFKVLPMTPWVWVWYNTG